MVISRLLFAILATSVSFTECALLPVDSKTNHLSEKEPQTVLATTEVNRVKRNPFKSVCQAEKQVIAPIVAQNIEGGLI